MLELYVRLYTSKYDIQVFLQMGHFRSIPVSYDRMYSQVYWRIVEMLVCFNARVPGQVDVLTLQSLAFACRVWQLAVRGSGMSHVAAVMKRC